MPDAILIVDDDPEMRLTLTRYLSSEGFDTVAVATGAAMEQALAKGDIDLVLLDLALRHETGLDLLKRLRSAGGIGVVILTGKSDPVDRIVGLELGADDYVTKPFMNRELLARINAVLRRTRGQVPAAEKPAMTRSARARLIRIDGWQIDVVTRQVLSAQGQKLMLTSAEFDILVALAENAGEPMSRDALSRAALQRPWAASDRSIDIHIHNLRKKFDAEQAGDLFVSVRNIGYVLAAEVSFA